MYLLLQTRNKELFWILCIPPILICNGSYLYQTVAGWPKCYTKLHLGCSIFVDKFVSCHVQAEEYTCRK